MGIDDLSSIDKQGDTKSIEEKPISPAQRLAQKLRAFSRTVSPRSFLQRFQRAPDAPITTVEDTKLTTDEVEKQPETTGAQIEAAPLVEEESYIPLTGDLAFFDAMPLTSDWETTEALRKLAPTLYGERLGSGKFGTVYGKESDRDTVTKLAHNPHAPASIYEAEFIRRFGGQAGLPTFEGFVPNGYKMEKLQGISLQDRLTPYMQARNPEEQNEALKNLLSKDEAQKLLDRIAEFHRITGRVHGDLFKPENIFITPDGDIRLIDPDWLQAESYPPEHELTAYYDYCTKALGIEGLTQPETISAELAEQNFANFTAEVRSKLVQSKSSSDVEGYKENGRKVRLGEEDSILVQQLPELEK